MKAFLRKFSVSFLFTIAVFGSGAIVGIGLQPQIVTIAYKFGKWDGGKAVLIETLDADFPAANAPAIPLTPSEIKSALK